MIIDTHAHLDHFSDERVPDIIKESQDAGVDRIITISSTQESWDACIRISNRFHNVFHTIGHHPHEAKDYSRELEDQMLVHLKSSSPVALGEIGLDFHYDFSEKKDQLVSFDRQLALAQTLNLPVVIHSRTAEKEVLELLDNYKGVRGVLHCYTGNYDHAKKFLDLGFLISVTGIITFKKSDVLRSVIEKIPLESLMLETDSPYLAPVPFRGKENVPAYVVKTAEALAGLLNKSMDDVASVTTQNAERLFSLL